jgi:hypothetical protein
MTDNDSLRSQCSCSFYTTLNRISKYLATNTGAKSVYWSCGKVDQVNAVFLQAREPGVFSITLGELSTVIEGSDNRSEQVVGLGQGLGVEESSFLGISPIIGR